MYRILQQIAGSLPNFMSIRVSKRQNLRLEDRYFEIVHLFKADTATKPAPEPHRLGRAD